MMIVPITPTNPKIAKPINDIHIRSNVNFQACASVMCVNVLFIILFFYRLFTYLLSISARVTHAKAETFEGIRPKQAPVG